ncbi:ephrin-A4 [Denticeps clupeoides]|uniref:ephrin-A4 n=1 Tax=Denticeps clupeoides TaxID=299321 RepID=UPI0010A371E8|nr:ephrin-A4-like [Denticeps clupeoides]
MSALWGLALVALHVVCAASGKRHEVYWNSTNSRLVSGDLSIEVNLNDYLDIFCPHYPADQPLQAPPETLSLYLSKVDFQGCVETKEAIMRWECNSPRAPYGPVRFSEKIQRFTPFSLGFEFLPGHHYYYTSFPTDDGPPLPCMKLRITVCCEADGPEPAQGTPAPHGGGDGVKNVPLLFFITSVSAALCYG